MLLFHGDASTAAADELHRRQFVLADMLRVDVGCAAETALLGIAAGIA